MPVASQPYFLGWRGPENSTRRREGDVQHGETVVESVCEAERERGESRPRKVKPRDAAVRHGALHSVPLRHAPATSTSFSANNQIIREIILQVWMKNVVKPNDKLQNFPSASLWRWWAPADPSPMGFSPPPTGVPPAPTGSVTAQVQSTRKVHVHWKDDKSETKPCGVEKDDTICLLLTFYKKKLEK